MNKKAKTAILAVLVILIGYGGSYVSVRSTRAETTAKGKRVLFPNEALATFFRPMSALDHALTGTESGVGNTETAPPDDEK
jgi:hypothetical protein